MGMAFTDALIDHAPDVRVALVDRRHGVGGHWLEAYPFVQLHQSSSFYGVASTLLGGGRVQERGPEAGLHERAGQPAILAYYADVLADRLLGSGRVEFFAGSTYVDDRTVVSRVSGQAFEVPDDCRVVDARYLAPDIPAEQPPRFAVEEGARVVPGQRPRAPRGGTEPVRRRGLRQDRHRRLRVAAGPRRGPGRDLLGAPPRAVDAQPRADPAGPGRLPRHGRLDAATRPRRPRPWTTCSSASRTPGSCCASTARSPRPWPRRPPWAPGSSTCSGASRTSSASATSSRVTRGRIDLEQGSVAVADDALVVNCAADGLKNPPLVPHLAALPPSPSSRSGPAFPASAPPWPATSRRPAPTTTPRTRCAAPRRTATR